MLAILVPKDSVWQPQVILKFSGVAANVAGPRKASKIRRGWEDFLDLCSSIDVKEDKVQSWKVAFRSEYVYR